MHLTFVSVAAAQPGSQPGHGVDQRADADQRHAQRVGVQDLRGHTAGHQQHAKDLQQFQRHDAMVAQPLPAGQHQRVLQLMTDVGSLREALRDAIWLAEQARIHLHAVQSGHPHAHAGLLTFLQVMQARSAELRATLLEHGAVA